MRARLELGSNVLLRLPRLRIAPSIALLDRHWIAKREFHVTLLNSRATRSAGPSSIAAAAAGRRFDVSLLDELWIVREGHSATIIQMAQVAAAGEFYAAIAIEPPPLHVTLYVSGTVRGIGIATRGELERMGRPLDAATRDSALVQMRESPQ